MKIATWNLERPKRESKKVPLIISCLEQLDADILILTETHEMIKPRINYSHFYTSKLKETFYKDGERRVSVYTKYPLVSVFDTYREDTSICKALATSFGELAVYGTIIGINGNRRHNFNTDLNFQLLDFEKIASVTNLCVAGDLNMSFTDNYYHTEDGRKKLNDVFINLNLTNLTSDIPENIDHIIISNRFLKNKEVRLSTWNVDKKLSDHIGICVTINEIS